MIIFCGYRLVPRLPRYSLGMCRTVVLVLIFHQVIYSQAGKSVMDFDDSDIERLYQEWEVR